MRALKVFTAGMITLAFLSPGFAHHGWSSYDQKNPVKAEGTIQHSNYQNPHGTIQLQSKDEKGGKVLEVILAPPSRMQARGLTEEMLKVGQKVMVEGYRKYADAKELRAERITVEEKTVELR